MSARRGSETASAAIWQWRDDARPGDALRARLGGLLRGLVGASVGAAAFYFEHVEIAYVAWGISGALTLLALASPLGAHAVVLRAMDGAGRSVGRLVGWLLLTPVYLFFFVPFRILFRRGARDRMTRRIDPDAASYWSTRDEDAQVLPMKRPY